MEEILWIPSGYACGMPTGIHRVYLRSSDRGEAARRRRVVPRPPKERLTLLAKVFREDHDQLSLYPALDLLGIVRYQADIFDHRT